MFLFGCLVSINGHSVSVWGYLACLCWFRVLFSSLRVQFMSACGHLILLPGCLLSLCVYLWSFCVSVVIFVTLWDSLKDWSQNSGGCFSTLQIPLSFSHSWPLSPTTFIFCVWKYYSSEGDISHQMLNLFSGLAHSLRSGSSQRWWDRFEVRALYIHAFVACGLQH